VQLARLGRTKVPQNGQLGYLFISFINHLGSPSRELVAVTVGKSGKNANWQVRIHPSCKDNREIKKVMLRRPDVPLGDVMVEVAKFYGPKRRLIAAQLDLNGHRQSWTNSNLSCEDPGRIFGEIELERLFQEIAAFHRGVDVWI
jgi:hypothetical protein